MDEEPRKPVVRRVEIESVLVDPTRPAPPPIPDDVIEARLAEREDLVDRLVYEGDMDALVELLRYCCRPVE